MSKKKQRIAGQDSGLVRLLRNTPGGGFIELPRAEAERLLAYEAHSGNVVHSLDEADTGRNQESDQES